MPLIDFKLKQIYRLSLEIPKRVICLCGSVRFQQQFQEIAEALSLEGYIVLGPTIFNRHADFHTGGPEMYALKDRLDALHFKKIELSDSVFVVDIDGYIGESTSREVFFARQLGKTVRYWSREKQDGQSIPFTCDHCSNAECSEPRRTIFNKARVWAYCGGCGQKGASE